MPAAACALSSITQGSLPEFFSRRAVIRTPGTGSTGGGQSVSGDIHIFLKVLQITAVIKAALVSDIRTGKPYSWRI